METLDGGKGVLGLGKCWGIRVRGDNRLGCWGKNEDGVGGSEGGETRISQCRMECCVYS